MDGYQGSPRIPASCTPSRLQSTRSQTSRSLRLCRSEHLPTVGAHSSVHHGVAVARVGGYLGMVVNVAARILAIVAGDDLVATAAVADATPDDFDWQRADTHDIRGVSQALELYRLGNGNG